jgi:hypothetical protein
MRLKQFFVLALIVTTAPLLAADQPVSEKTTAAEKIGGDKKDTATEEKSDDDSNADDDEKSEVTAIVGGDIYTVTNGMIRSGTILIQDGKITAIGQNIDVPDNAKTIDAHGKKICPGFVAIEMSGVGLDRSASDRNAKYEDSLDPFDRNVKLSLGIGITTGCISVSSGGRRFRGNPDEEYPRDNRFAGLDPDQKELEGTETEFDRNIGEYEEVCKCCGLRILSTAPILPPRPSAIRPSGTAAVKMSFGILDGMLLEQDVFVDLSPGALTGATNQKAWREMLEKARKYLDDKAAHEKEVASGKKSRPPRKSVGDEILKLVQGKAAVRISEDSESGIKELVGLSKELDYDLVITSATECWLATEEIAASDTSLIITPRQRREPNFGEEDTSGTLVETPRVLEESGIPFAVAALSNRISLGGLAGRDLTSLPLEAAFAVRGGASESEALASITITPANMMGLGNRIGSLEEGKDADILILNGNPLDYRTYVQTALVNGNIVYERAEAKVLPVYDR